MAAQGIVKRRRNNMWLGNKLDNPLQPKRVTFTNPVAKSIVSSVNEIQNESRTELDSHANMVVIGCESMVIGWIEGKTYSAIPFDPSIGCVKSVPIIDAALAYDCPYIYETYILIGRNVMYIKTLRDNLIAPFIMREAGIIVDEKPKVQCVEPSVDNHSLYVPDFNLRIPLKLNAIFSYFATRKPTKDEVDHCK